MMQSNCKQCPTSSKVNKVVDQMPRPKRRKIDINISMQATQMPTPVLPTTTTPSITRATSDKVVDTDEENPVATFPTYPIATSSPKSTQKESVQGESSIQTDEDGGSC